MEVFNITYFLTTIQSISKGFDVTLSVFFLTIICSLPLGLIVSLGAISKNPILKWIVSTYVWVLRGTPLMLQIFAVYYIPPILSNGQYRLDNFSAAILAFVLNYTAYFSEIFRSGIQSIDRGQYESAKALGFSPSQTMLRIIIPQTIRRVLPPISNETITLVKDTVLVSVISLTDILLNTKTLVSRNSDVIPYIVVACFYLLMTLVLTWFFKFLEKKYTLPE